MSAESRFSEAAVLIGEPNASNRETYNYAFQTKGFGQVKIVALFPDFKDALKQEPFDLVICDTELPGGDLCDLIRESRQGKLHPDNAFAVTICLAPAPTQDILKGTMEAGFDKVLFGSEGQRKLFNVIGELMRGRQTFIVKTDYVGPRRPGLNEPFPGEDEPKTVKTPNPLRMLADGSTREDLEQVMAEVAADLNNKKVESHVEHLLWAIEKIKNFMGARDMDAEIRDVAGQIIDAAADLNARIDNQALSHVRDLCDVLVLVSTRITSTSEEISATDLELLPNLGQAIEVAFSQGESAEQDAKLILESLE